MGTKYGQYWVSGQAEAASFFPKLAGMSVTSKRQKHYASERNEESSVSISSDVVWSIVAITVGKLLSALSCHKCARCAA